MRHTLLFSALYNRFVVLFALLATSLATYAQPMVKAEGTTKISEHVYVIPDNSVPGVPNVGIIVGSKSTLIIDTGMGKANGDIILQQARKLDSDNDLYLVTTHVHPEHDLGAHAFPESTQMIRSQDQIKEIAETGYRTRDAFSSRSDTNAKLLAGAEFREADIVFEKEYLLDLGGVTVIIQALGPNHTLGDTIMVVEKEGVLFSGDIAMSALPAFASSHSSISHWQESLTALEDFKPTIVVPSHGPNGDVGFIRRYQQFLSAVQSRASELKRQGKSLEEVTATITRELEPEFGTSRRMAGAIRNAYNESHPG